MLIPRGKPLRYFHCLSYDNLNLKIKLHLFFLLPLLGRVERGRLVDNVEHIASVGLNSPTKITCMTSGLLKFSFCG